MPDSRKNIKGSSPRKDQDTRILWSGKAKRLQHQEQADSLSSSSSLSTPVKNTSNPEVAKKKLLSVRKKHKF